MEILGKNKLQKKVKFSSTFYLLYIIAYFQGYIKGNPFNVGFPLKHSAGMFDSPFLRFL